MPATASSSRHVPEPPSSPTSSISINPRTSSTSAGVMLEPPRTPPNPTSKSKGKQAARMNDAEREDLLVRDDDIAAHRLSHVSHGLSWGETARNSVVDNMLLSLDSMPGGDMGSMAPHNSGVINRDFDIDKFRMPDIPLWQQNVIASNPISRSRGHTHSSSLSSEFRSSRTGAESPASFKTASTTKGRRSASGSGLGIVANPPFFPQPQTKTERRTSTDTQKWIAGPSANPPSAAPPAAKEPAFTKESNPRAWKRRSMSVDQLYHEAVVTPSSILHRGRPVPSMHSTYDSYLDSAPEPSIAGGPRNKQNPGFGPAYVGPAPKQSLRKVTTQGDLRAATKSSHAPPTPNIPQNVLEQANTFVRAASIRAVQSPMAAEPRTGSQAAMRNDAPREKQGFFKRVFGGSSRSSSTALPERSDSQTAASIQTPRKSAAHPRSTTPTTSRPDTQHTTKEPKISYPPPSLNKKPSSFFRRRKKSVSDADVPPVPALNQSVQRPSESRGSMSSLRKVMNPFLNDDKKAVAPSATGAQNPGDEAEDLHLFHSGYTPPTDSVADNFGIPASILQAIDASPRPSSQPKMKIKKRNDNDPHDEISPISSDAMSAEAFLKISSSPVSPVSQVDSGRVNTPSTYKAPVDTARGVSIESNSRPTIGEDGFILRQGPRSPTPKSDRLYLKLIESEDARKTSIETFSSSGAPQLRASESRSSSAVRHSPVSNINGATALSVQVGQPQVATSMVGIGAEYHERAKKIFDGIEDDVSRADASSWLGERNNLSSRTLEAYMQLFDFTGLSILSALRALCSKLLLRGETQQFDRIIQALSTRWCQCNSDHGFKAEDVVHTICYSLILLNTDLHLADINEKMSRSAYIKNTLPTIRRVVSDAAPNAFDETIKPSPVQSRPSVPWMDTTPTASSPTSPVDGDTIGSESLAASLNLAARPSIPRNDSEGWTPENGNDITSDALVNAPWNGTSRTWEVEVEAILKTFYNSIRAEPLPLTTKERTLPVPNGPSLRRSGSMISKAPSEAPSYRSKAGLKTMASAWQSRNVRNRQKIYPNSTFGSSRTSFDDSNSIWSPAQSSNWSRTTNGKPFASPSTSTFQSVGDPYKHSIGFANALSQAIVRDENPGTPTEGDSIKLPGGLLDDEALALEGAPWAKEGLVKHKHHLETPDRKAKERNWTDCFAVISKGKLTLFNFNTSTKSSTAGRKSMSRAGRSAASVTAPRVGGGDWMENAERLGTFVLRHVIASTLPPPGYSKARPHVWALSFPTGAVHLFQVGTPEIAKEFMTTANYWSARLSKEPLSGSVSNVEYGWSDGVINMAAIDRTDRADLVASPPPSIQNFSRSHIRTPSLSSHHGARPSFQSSLRTSIDAGFGGSKLRLPGDKIHVADWKPPTQSMMASQLLEVDQLRQLTEYVKEMESELAAHNELKHGIELAFSPRHTNYSRAMSNWQRKSDYLLREIVKFQTYVDTLNSAQQSREEYNKRKAEMDATRWKALDEYNSRVQKQQS